MGSLSSTTQTDSAGRYRLERVPPGRYHIVAGVGIGVAMTGGRGARCGDTRAISEPTYFPGTFDIARAEAVAVDSGALVTREFQLAAPVSATPLFTLKGRVISPSPLDTSRGYKVTLSPQPGPATTPCARQTPLFGIPGGDGLFDVRNVPAGRYAACLVIDQGDFGLTVSGPVIIDVKDRNTAELTFTAR
jgi:hypothetical protein